MSRILVALFTLALGSTAMSGAISFSYDKIAFYSLYPNMEIEEFAGADVVPGTLAAFAGPIDVTANNRVFSPGDVLDGIVIRTLQQGRFTEFDSSLFVALGSGVAGLPGQSIAVYQDSLHTDKISLHFSHPQTQVGISISSIDLRSLSLLGASILVDIFADASDETSRIGGVFLNVSESGIPAFLGISPSDPFHRIDMHSQTAYSSPVISEVAFGAKASIPEPSTLLLLALGLFGTFARLLRRRAA